MNYIIAYILTLGLFAINYLNEAGPVQQDRNLSQLPLIIKPALKSSSNPVFYLISGDGGWNNFDNTFCDGLAKSGIPVVGLDSKKYFWTAKSPEETAQQLNTVIENFNRKFQKDSLVIAGYSFGADLVPFIVNRLPEATRNRITKVILLSPDRFGDFEIHLSDMLNMGVSKRKYNVIEEVRKTSFVNTTCLFGKNEESVNINAFKTTGSTIIMLPGDHHYNNNFGLLEDILIKVIAHH
jgi:type IV secretory pathway VirJ component